MDCVMEAILKLLDDGVYLLCGKSDHEQRRSWKRVWKVFVDYVKEKSKEKDCKALILDSGLPRVEAHGFMNIMDLLKIVMDFSLFYSMM